MMYEKINNWKAKWEHLFDILNICEIGLPTPFGVS